MSKDDDLLSQYRANEAKAEQAIAYDKQINDLESKQESFLQQREDMNQELSELANKANDSREDGKKFHEKAGEFQELESKIRKNDQKLKDTRQEYDSWKQQQKSKGQEANQETVNKDYQDREGRPLDKNVGGYDSKDEAQPLDDKSKQQADLLNQYKAENQKEAGGQQQEQQKDNNRDEPER